MIFLLNYNEIVWNFVLGKIDSQLAREQTETAPKRYSLVCNAIIAVANETDNDRLNDIALTCAELTACCNALSGEWLGKIYYTVSVNVVL